MDLRLENIPQSIKCTKHKLSIPLTGPIITKIRRRSAGSRNALCCYTSREASKATRHELMTKPKFKSLAKPHGSFLWGCQDRRHYLGSWAKHAWGPQTRQSSTSEHRGAHRKLAARFSTHQRHPEHLAAEERQMAAQILGSLNRQSKVTSCMIQRTRLTRLFSPTS